MSELKALAEQAQLKRQLAEAAQEASRTATSAQVNAINTMLKRLSANLKQIKATAAGASDPSSIYDLGGIPAPKTPSDLGAPEAPSTQQATLTQEGTIVVTWKSPARHAFEGKTFFIVQRRITAADNQSGPWMLIGTSSEKRFTDPNVPRGVHKVDYRIFATRNDEMSDASGNATINFGTPPTTVGTEQKGKAAA